MFPLHSEEKDFPLVPKINGVNCISEVSVFLHQFKTKQDESTLHGFMDTGIQVVDHWILGYQKNSLKPRDTLSCSWGCWAFLGNDFNAGSFVQSKHRLTLNENTVRGWDTDPKVYIVESNIRGRLKISSWCLGKTFVAHRLCGHEVPQLLQEEKKELSCVHGWSTESSAGTRRKSAEWLQVSWGLSPFPQLSASSTPMADSVCLLLPGFARLQQKIGKNSCIGKEIS